MHVGLHQHELEKQGLALNACDATASLGRPDVLLVDLREHSERARHGTLSGALHAPYPGIGEGLRRAACCAKSSPQPDAASYFSAPSSNARRWPSRLPGAAAWPTPPISRAASMPGRRPAHLSIMDCV
jgi:hypothetical protein